MKKAFRVALAIAAVAAFILAFNTAAFADFGDYGGDSDYGDFGDYGGDSDYGDFGGDSYDYGGNDYDYDFGGNDYDYDSGNGYDYNYGSDGGGVYVYNDSGSGTFSENDSGSTITGLIVIVAIIVIIVVVKKKKGASPARVQVNRSASTASTMLRPMPEYMALDASFSEPEFCEKASNLYVQFQNAWQAKDIECLRADMTAAFFAQTNRQLDAYRKKKETNRIERISVLSVNLKGWTQDTENDIIIAELNTRIVDYVVSDETCEVVRGDANDEKFMTYEWTFVRSTGEKTSETEGTKAFNCPNCGAPVDINRSAKCEYCDSVLTADKHGWAVAGIKGIKQQTVVH